MANTDVRTKLKPNLMLKEPSLYKVLYINDEVTTMEFVVYTLMEYFDYSKESALAITDEIHEAGSAVVAVLPYEIAEQLGIEITLDARKQGFPLQVKIESKS